MKNWKNGNGKEMCEFMDKAIRDGKADWFSIWKTKGTLILLHLYGGIGRIIFEISYADLKHKALTEKELL
jgi:hypothetical protein